MTSPELRAVVLDEFKASLPWQVLSEHITEKQNKIKARLVFEKDFHKVRAMQAQYMAYQEVMAFVASSGRNSEEE